MRCVRLIGFLEVAVWLAIGWELSARAEITAVVNSDRVNVRGQATLFSEVVTQLRQGEQVTVLESIKVSRPKPGEPAEWAKVQIPANTPVWVTADGVDAQSKQVKFNRLNVRAGPGENFSVIGQLQRGDSIREIRLNEGWIEIEAPPTAYGFVAAPFLNRPATSSPVQAAATATPNPAATPPANPAPRPAAQPTTVAPASTPTTSPGPAANAAPPGPATPTPAPDTRPNPAAAGNAVPTAEPPSSQPVAGPGPTPLTATQRAGREPEAPPRKRIISREGVVADTVSIQAPTYFLLLSSPGGRVLNYLLPASPDQKLGIYRWQRVVVTGEEQLDPRWPNTPMIEVQRVQLAP